MLFSEIKIGDKELKLRLDSRSCVSLERKLGKNPLSIFMNEDKSLPKLEDLIAIFHASLQKYNQGYNEEKTYDLYDEYINEGNTFIDLIPVIMDIFKVSGFFKESEVEKAQVELEKKPIAVVKNL